MMVYASQNKVVNWATLDAFFEHMQLLFQERERRQKALTKLNYDRATVPLETFLAKLTPF